MFRLQRYDFDYIMVEVYDTFKGGKYMCRLELFKGGRQIQNRIMKFESHLDETFVKRAENKLYEKNIHLIAKCGLPCLIQPTPIQGKTKYLTTPPS